MDCQKDSDNIVTVALRAAISHWFIMVDYDVKALNSDTTSLEKMVIKVGIVGGTGYTGVELLRILAVHPEVSVSCITSRSEAGMPVAEMYPNLRGHYDLAFSEPDVNVLGACDLVFFATPHGVAMRMVPELMSAGVRVVDLSADFRLKDLDVWANWYGMAHESPEWAEKAVYGLPEVVRDEIRTAQLVANPGCYPTAVQLGFLPLLEQGLVDPKRLIADAKSGASGAGRQGKRCCWRGCGCDVRAPPDSDDPRHRGDALRRAEESGGL